MVQRKVVNKLGIQVESSKKYAASEKKRSTALKPCYQHQDGKNKGGGDIKKKMKKSRSIKLLDIENLRPPPRQDQSKIKKLPVTDVSNITASQKKTSPLVKTLDGSPNYMKPTSSSYARKERLDLQVSPQSRTSDKNNSPKNFTSSKPSLGLKPMKVLKRNSSLKPVRSSMKKSYGVASYHPKLNANRATCSSTLKDSKFPAYVDLHPEGTELEGTSVMKVCPYTYCSLNGHLHAALPPLKHFLSARRRLLKTQKSMKLKALSSPRQKNSGGRKKEIVTGQIEFDGDPVTGSAVPIVLKEVHPDFFVEIFAKPRGENAESENYSDANKHNSEPEFNISDTTKVLIPSSESAETNMEDDGVPESHLTNNLGHNNGIFTAETDVSMKFPEDIEFGQEVLVWDTDNLAGWIEADQVKTSYKCCKETETICEGMDKDKSVSDATDMDWEEGAPDFDNGTDYSAFSEDGSVSLTSHVPGNEAYHDLTGDPVDSIRANEVVLEEANTIQVHKEDAESFINYEGNDFKLDGDENLMIHEVCDAVNGLNHNQPSEAEPFSQDFADNVAGDPTQTDDESRANPEQEKNDYMYEHASVGDDTKGSLDQPICTTGMKSLEYHTETEQGAVKKHQSSDYQHSATYSEIPELNETDDSNGLLKIQISDFSETGQDTATSDRTNMDAEVCQCDDGCCINQENRRKEEAMIDLCSITPGQSFPPASLCTFDAQPVVHNMEENQDSEKDQGKLGYHYISKSTCFEECDDKEKYRSTSAEDCIRTSDKMQFEEKTVTNAEKAYVPPNIKSSEKDEAITNAGSNSNKPLPETVSNLKWKQNKVGKRPIENCDQLKKFNPRPPRYLLPEPDPEAEKVDLRHQMMDERKNAEEWMIDYALQKTVTKLAPARKRRVALLVEAFETVMPPPKCEAHLRHAAASFTHARPIQACN
ncbi:midasin [Cinnamomum micranthum f. kanehirae]|uniref:Midasin n=1 Tax=Cinnamomum micranthum f. kanehirae TaxID=337451 RepID=A0A3S3PW94_9MAGN|nr:midasin [Cinnamomum micranthum f. kanehirae]